MKRCELRASSGCAGPRGHSPSSVRTAPEARRPRVASVDSRAGHEWRRRSAGLRCRPAERGQWPDDRGDRRGGVPPCLRPSAPQADEIPSVSGSPARRGPRGVQECIGSIDTRVPSWDGVPLDVNITFRPAAQDGALPLDRVLTGGAGARTAPRWTSKGLAQQGYAVMAYSARGFGKPCGRDGVPRARLRQGLDPPRRNARFGRATPSTSRAAHDRPVEPGIGSPGTPTGAASRSSSRRSGPRHAPERTCARGAARWRPNADRGGRAADRVVDLSYALFAERGTLDFRSRNPHRRPPACRRTPTSIKSVPDRPDERLLRAAGRGPAGEHPGQFDLSTAGEPYDSNPALRGCCADTKRYHSAYYVEQGLWRQRVCNPPRC